jgi:hypothetical protein
LNGYADFLTAGWAIYWSLSTQMPDGSLNKGTETYRQMVGYNQRLKKSWAQSWTTMGTEKARGKTRRKF